MFEDVMVAAMPDNPALSLQPGDHGRLVRVEGQFWHQRLHPCAIICAFLNALSILRLLYNLPIQRQAVLAAFFPSAACAAASRAIGTRNGEHDT
jgi:hypothetical protein